MEMALDAAGRNAHQPSLKIEWQVKHFDEKVFAADTLELCKDWVETKAPGGKWNVVGLVSIHVGMDAQGEKLYTGYSVHLHIGRE